MSTDDQGDVGLRLSIVVPVYDEEENVEPLYESLVPVLESIGDPWEMVYVDDGSKDATLIKLTQIANRDSRVRVVALRRNFGQTAAMAAGIDHALGDIIVTMDGDLQNSPEDIPKMLDKLDEGYDIVSGWRRERHDPWLSRKLPSLMANKLASFITRLPLHDYGCTQKVYRREVLQGIRLYGELHRFIPALAQSVGAKVTEIEVSHFARQHGTSKYGISRVLRGVLDLIALRLVLSYMTKPMQIFGGVGFLMFALAMFSGVTTLGMKVFGSVDITGNPMLYVALLGVITGVQLISLGFLGEINVRTYHETQHKPTYVVRDVYGGGATSTDLDQARHIESATNGVAATAPIADRS